MERPYRAFFLLVVALAGWFVPGAGYLLLNERNRAIIVFVTIALTFCIGIYISSIGIIDPIGARIVYMGQILNSPAVALIGNVTAAGTFPVYGKPNEIGQIYTIISGMLNLLCIVNAVYMAHLQQAPSRRTGCPA
jgi:hypothetical protein